MEYIRFGGGKDKVSIIGVGTWKMGKDQATETKAIRHAIDLGINLIDTAEMYGTEQLVGSAIKGYEREDLFISTKVSPHHFHREDVASACKRSLSKLGLRYVDLYYLHWPSKRIPIVETMKAMEHLMDEGLIRHIGISNYDVDEAREAQAALDHSRIEAAQDEYSVVVRGIEGGMLDYCRQNKMEMLAYSPVARGTLLEKKYVPLLEKLSDIGDDYGKTPVQVALNWLMCKGTIPIPKAASVDHVVEDADAAAFWLSKRHVGEIDLVSEGYQKRPLGGAARGLLKRTSIWARAMTKTNERAAAKQ